MQQGDWEALNLIVVESTTSVLSTFGISATYAGPVRSADARWADTLAIIGLGGTSLRGSLVLSVPTLLLASSNPTKRKETADAVDWLAELTNLLVGKIKSQLVIRRVIVGASTPVTISGRDFRFRRFTGNPIVHSYDTAGGPVYVVIEAIAEAEVSLSEPDPRAAVATGDVVLF